MIQMDVVEAIYEEGNLRVLDPSKIDSELITVKILNIEEVLCIRQFEFDPSRQSDFDPLLSG